MSETSDKSIAVYAKDLRFSYTTYDLVLNDINLNVRNGDIYGLLGPSGCGKTTLLKCILGRLKPSGGDVEILGTKPGSPECHIPGAAVGYMPQELGLYMDFTVDEILTYFGKIFSMNKSEIKEKTTEIRKLLKLPQNHKLIGKYSGGQKRRISLACALIHSPPLLILDEPTVGTDPILRRTILTYLTSLGKRGVTVILTTHYIEEARNADVVAFMRSGKILVEDEPNILLNKYMSTTLEEVFLKLCDSEENEKKNKSDFNSSLEVVVNNKTNCSTNEIIDDKIVKQKNNHPVNIGIIKREIHGLPIDTGNYPLTNGFPVTNGFAINGYHKQKVSETIELKKTNTFSKCSALLHKNFKRLSRNWMQLIFFVLFPAIELTICLYSIGEAPRNIKLALFDQESVSNVTNPLGQLFMESISNVTFDKITFDNYEKAMNSVKSGQTMAFVHINDRFSKAFRLRVIYGNEADDQTLEESQIRVHIDWSNQMIGLQIERYLYEAMMKFGEKLAIRTNVNPDTIKIPLLFEKPVYGVRSESLRDFVLPGVFILLAFFATCVVTTHMILDERKDGILERSQVAGITALDYLFSHLFTQSLIFCIQLVVFLSIPPILFDIKPSGSLTLVIALLLSQGLCGTVYGVMVSVLSSDTIYASMFLVLSFLTCIIMGGVLWPIENMPGHFQKFGKLMPNTIPSISMRSILYREWTLTNPEVYMGFVVTYVWLLFFLIICFIFIRKHY